MNAVNDMLNLVKGRTQKYTHKKRVHSASKGKMVWRYFYKEHHGKGATHVDDLKEGEAFKVNYNGNEGHFHIDKVDGDNITVIHDETKEKKTLTKRELRAVLLSTHAEALKANVKKKEARFKNAKSKKAKKNAKRRLEQARKKATPRKQMVQTAENVQDNFETMPETETKQETNWLTLSDQEYIDKNRKLEQDKETYGQIPLQGLTDQQNTELKVSTFNNIKRLEKELGKDQFKRPKDIKELIKRMKGLKGHLKKKYGIELDHIFHLGYKNEIKLETSTPRKLRNLVGEKHYRTPFMGYKGSSNQLIDPLDLIKLLETLERDQAQTSQEPTLEQETEPTPAPTDARQDLVQQAEQVIQETHDKHDDKPLERKPLKDFEIGEHVHTRTGETAHTVKSKKRVPRDKFFEQKRVAKRLDGFYSKFTKKWHFKDKDKALEFAHHFEPEATEPAPTPTDAKHEHLEHHTDNFETMPEVESVETSFSPREKQKILDAIRQALRFDRTGKTRSKNRQNETHSNINIAGLLFDVQRAKLGRKIIDHPYVRSAIGIDQFNVGRFLEILAKKKMTEEEVLQAFEKLLAKSYPRLLDKYFSDPQFKTFDTRINVQHFEAPYETKLRTRQNKHLRFLSGDLFDKEAKELGLRARADTIEQGLKQARTTIEDYYKQELAHTIATRDDKSDYREQEKKIKSKLADLKQQLKSIDQIPVEDTNVYAEHVKRAIDALPLSEQPKYKDKLKAQTEQYKESAKKELPKMIQTVENDLKKTQDALNTPFTEKDKTEYQLELLNNRMKELKDVEKDTYHRTKLKTLRGKALHKLETKIVERMISDFEQDKRSFGSSSKEILAQYDTSGFEIKNSEDFGKLDPQSSLERHDSYISIYRKIEDKLKDIDDGRIKNFSYRTHGTLRDRARGSYNLNKVKQDLNPAEIVENSFSITGYNDSVTNRFTAVDEGIDKLAQKHDYIDDVRENKDAILAELKQMAQSTYENRIKGFESYFRTDYKKEAVEKVYRQDLKNTLKDKQNALERLKSELPSSVHQALKTESEKGLEQHTKDVEVMINHYNTELDKIVDKEKAHYPTKGDIYNTIQANLPKFKNPHLKGVYTGEKKFEAKVQGRPHKKLIAKMFNEIMEQVAQEKANEPTGLVESAPAPQPMNARDQMVQTAENVQDNFETMPEVDYESLNRGQKIKIQGNVYTIGKKSDRSFNSVGHGIQLNDENGKLSGILIFNDNGKVRFTDKMGTTDIKDLKEAQLITGNKEQSIKFKNDPREPLPKPTGGIVSNMSRRREAQKQARQPRKEDPQAVSPVDQTAGDKHRLETLKTNLDIELENAVQMQETARAQKNLPHPKDGGGEFHLTNQIDPRYMEALEFKMYRGFKSAVPNLHPQNVVKLDNMYYMNVAQVRADAQKQEDEYYKLFKVLINDKINKYTEAHNNIKALKKDIEERIPYADTNGTEETRKAHQDYLLKVSKEAFKQLKSVEETKGQAFNALKKTYFTAKKTGHAKHKALAEIANKAIDRVYQEIKDQPTSKPDVMYFVSIISKYSKQANARDQMVQTAENVQDNFETMPEPATKTTPQEPQNLQHTQADLNAISTREFERAYYNQSHSPEARGRSKRKEYVNTLNEFEALAQELIELGADKAKVQQLAQQSAERYTNALKDELSSEAKTASWAVVGAGGFNTRRQEKLRGYADNKRSKTIQAKNQAIKNFEKLRLSDPNSAQATRDQRNQEVLKEIAELEKRAEDTRAKAKAEKVTLPTNTPLQMTKQNFHSLKSGDRIKLTYKIDRETKTEELQVGRESYSKRNFTTTRKLHPVINGKADKTIDVSIYSMENHPNLSDMLRLSDGRARWGNTELQNFELLPSKKTKKKPRPTSQPTSAREQTATAQEMTPQAFSDLKTGTRIKMNYKDSVGYTQTREFEIGRTSYSKKYKVKTRRLYPVENGQANKSNNIAPYKLFYREATDRVTMSHGGGLSRMQSFENLGMKKAYKRASARDLLLKALIA